ncbi:MAG: polysaccharide deacetylase family protein [Saprospiraceae bacterium]|nr:polysaccharide deacetylase family protein [Saprospiraceae bacterium]
MSVESKPTHITEKKFCWLPTFDIDVAFAYRHKPIFLLILRSMYELFQFQFKSLLERFKTLFLNQKDPYDTYGFIHSIHKNGIKPIFFWLVAPSRNKYDTNISPFNPEIKSLINKWSEIYDIGIHPSYTSNFNPENINTEKNILQNIITKPVTKSRQHYLMLKLPATYRRLIDNSITDDYTMGYHNTVGFRAGTSFPFLWYDLENEQTTTLRVHPFCIMDVALKNHMELSSNEAWLITKKIIDTLKKADGIFMSIWHNSSFSEIHGWSGWKEFYQEIDDYCHAINEM